MTSHDSFKAGDLKGATAAALDTVRNKPDDIAARGFLCELLCFGGDWERADKQLDALTNLDPSATPGVALFRQLIRAAEARDQFYTAGRVPEFLELPTPLMKLHLEASILVREGNAAEAAKKLAEAEEARPKVAGMCDGVAFDDFRDADDLTASFVEVLTSNGKYYWVPTDKIESLEIRPPARARDLLWIRTRMIVRGGPDGEVYLPCLYAGAHTEGDDLIRLGRSTNWRTDPGLPARGVGARVFLVGSEGKSLPDMKDVTFNE